MTMSTPRPEARPMYRRPEPPRPWADSRRRSLQLLLVGALLVVAVAVAVSTLGKGRESVATTTPSEPFTGAVPAEWAPTPLWQSPPLMPSSGRALVVGGDSVAMITADRKVVLVDAASGETRWAATLPEGTPATSLANTVVDGTEGVAAQVGDRLAFWKREDGDLTEYPLPPGSTTTFKGASPLAAASGVATVITQGKPVQVTLPAGARPLAARADGTVTAVAGNGWWHLRPGAAPGPATPWESPVPGRITPSVIDYGSGSILTILPGARAQALVYSDREKDVRLAFRGPVVVPGGSTAKSTWRQSTSGAWGILDRTLVDLRQGRLQDLGAWTTRLVSADRALGRVGSQDVVVGPSIPRGVLAEGEGFPEDLTAAGALVRSRTESGEMIALLPPKNR